MRKALGLAAAVALGALGGVQASTGLGNASAVADCARPYSSSSPWNTPIGDRPHYHPRSDFHVASMSGTLSSDPRQFTYPVYEVSKSTPLQTVSLRGWFSEVVDGNRTLRNQRAGNARLPIPEGAAAAAGSDAQMIMIDPATGEEWGASNLERIGEGRWQAWNAYHYSTKWSGSPPRDSSGRPFFARGSGLPYLSGLVRPCEIQRGRIEHALAFAYDSPAPGYVYPATKSDGKSTNPAALPEGSRLQLDPKLSADAIRGWGCTGPCFTIAHALQRYGMYVIDASGREKVMLEYEGTASWGGLVNSRTVAPIPLSAFKLLEWCTIVGTPRADVLRGTAGRDVVCGREGPDRLLGGDGDDLLYGHDGNDVVLGQAGSDELLGDAGADTLRGGRDADVILARDRKRDSIDGGDGRDVARVDRGLDRLTSVERRLP